MVVDYLCENIAEPSPVRFRLNANVPNAPPLSYESRLRYIRCYFQSWLVASWPLGANDPIVVHIYEGAKGRPSQS